MSERVTQPVEHVLDSAVTQLREHGWTRGRFLDYATGSMCMAGAICSVRHDLRGTWLTDPIDAKALDYLGRALLVEYGNDNVADVNDLVMTCPEQAIAALEKARALAAEEGA